MRSPRYGNNTAVQVERVQEARFERLMSCPEQRDDAENIPGEFRVSIFELLRARQPAAAWAMGHMAGWPEMTNA